MMDVAHEQEPLHHFGGGIYAKQFTLPAGESVIQHRHNYDHMALLATGTVQLSVDGTVHEVTGPAALTIQAGKHHGIKAVTDSVWFCIHAEGVADLDHLTLDTDRPRAQRVADSLQLGTLP